MVDTIFDPSEHVQLVAFERVPYKQLAGYQKFHRVPESASPSENRALFELSADDLSNRLDSYFSRLRKEFGLKRKQLVATPIEGGCGAIETPGFNFLLQAELDPDDPATVLFRSTVSQIRDPDELVGKPFENTFGDRFRELLVSVPEPLCVESVVDLLEDLDEELGAIEYDRECTWVELQIGEANAVVRIDANSVSVKSLESGTPAGLFEIFLKVKRTLESVVGFKE